MHDEAATQYRPEPADQPSAGWQTPDFTVIDTALEVTAYFLRDK
jgi:coenzyme PQQ precursor peptide PqqA